MISATISVPCLVVAVMLATGIASAAPVQLHVAPDGNDKASGTLQAPFATLERARERIRARKAAGGLPEGGFEVILHEGVYERGDSFVLTAADSGTEEAPVVFRAAEGEQVIVSGGRRVTDWRPVTDPAILARLDEPARGHVLQADLRAMGIEDLGDVIKPGARLELFCDGRPMTVARWPNEGFVRIGETVGDKPFDVRGTRGNRVGKFTFDFDRPERWVDEKDLWLHGYWFWDWSDQRQRVKAIDLQARTIELEEPYHHYGYRKGHWYYAFNALCEIDTPGEWYLDRETGILYFWPPSPVEDADVVVSVCGDLFSIDGASWVTVRGLTFETARGRALNMSNCSDCRIVACTMRNLGDWAVRAVGGERNAVVGCDMYDLAEGGVFIEGGDRKTLTP
ncbi:MAG: right-handed parallel beta-helix repeat-containing protein, partial [Armatimonadetes bacterium]|nr:right-handed parallel beta-helix repeat-containing protein [Armatimonadota bacterium]